MAQLKEGFGELDPAEFPHLYYGCGTARVGSTPLANVLGLAGIPSYYQPVKSILRCVLHGAEPVVWRFEPSQRHIFAKETFGPFTVAECIFLPVELLLDAGFPRDRLHVIMLDREPASVLASWFDKLSHLLPETTLFAHYLIATLNAQRAARRAMRHGVRVTTYVYELSRNPRLFIPALFERLWNIRSLSQLRDRRVGSQRRPRLGAVGRRLPAGAADFPGARGARIRCGLPLPRSHTDAVSTAHCRAACRERHRRSVSQLGSGLHRRFRYRSSHRPADLRRRLRSGTAVILRCSPFFRASLEGCAANAGTCGHPSRRRASARLLRMTGDYVAQEQPSPRTVDTTIEASNDPALFGPRGKKHARSRRQTAFVTGGAGGIGFALGRAFAQAGMKVTLADIETDALEAAVKGLRTIGRCAAWFVTLPMPSVLSARRARRSRPSAMSMWSATMPASPPPAASTTSPSIIGDGCSTSI